VDDDADLCLMLRDLFQELDFAVDFEADGAHGLARAQAEVYDLLILDVMMPGCDGFDVLRQIRQQSHVPVLMLTAKSDRLDRVQGFELGADDYLPKPFYPEELLARVRAILRRAAEPAKSSPDMLRVGDLTLLPGTRSAFYCGRPLGLTAMECEILEQLMRSCGKAVSRDQLSFHLYNRQASPYDRSIDTHMSRIRRKIGAGNELIVSVRGTGYQLCADLGQERNG
jgi:two-component system, OmpR family, response regulator CpxR